MYVCVCVYLYNNELEKSNHLVKDFLRKLNCIFFLVKISVINMRLRLFFFFFFSIFDAL